MNTLRTPRPARTATALLTFLLICVFAGLSLLLVVIGAGVYRSVTQTAARNSALRASVNYVCGKVRAMNETDTLRVADLEGYLALAIDTDYDQEVYTTFIYCMDGALRELFVGPGAEIGARDGIRLTQAQQFTPEVRDGLCAFTITLTDDFACTQHIALRGEGMP